MKHQGRMQVALAMLACVGLLAVPSAEAKQPGSIVDRPLHTVHEDPEPFLFQSAGRTYADAPLAAVDPIAVFFGTFMSHEAQVDGGRGLVAQFKLADPAPAIAESLGRETCPLVDCTMIIHELADNALTLSVRTTDWALTPLSFAWNRYRIYYKVDARLLDHASDKVLASAEFVYSDKYDDPDKAPILEDMLRDDAALLKAKFREVEPLAVAELREEFAEDLRRSGLLRTS